MKLLKIPIGTLLQTNQFYLYQHIRMVEENKGVYEIQINGETVEEKSASYGKPVYIAYSTVSVQIEGNGVVTSAWLASEAGEVIPLIKGNNNLPLYKTVQLQDQSTKYKLFINGVETNKTLTLSKNIDIVLSMYELQIETRLDGELDTLQEVYCEGEQLLPSKKGTYAVTILGQDSANVKIGEDYIQTIYLKNNTKIALDYYSISYEGNGGNVSIQDQIIAPGQQVQLKGFDSSTVPTREN